MKAQRAKREPEVEGKMDPKFRDATGFHPKNPWRGKLEEEEIIVLHFIVYYRGHGFR